MEGRQIRFVVDPRLVHMRKDLLFHGCRKDEMMSNQETIGLEAIRAVGAHDSATEGWKAIRKSMVSYSDRLDHEKRHFWGVQQKEYG